MSFDRVSLKIINESKDVVHSILHPVGVRRVVVLGASRSGKTASVIPDLLKTLRQPHALWIVSPNHNQSVYRQIAQQFREQGVKTHSSSSLDIIGSEILDEKKSVPPNGEHNVVIIDDFFGRDLQSQFITRLFTESAHIGCSVILLTQNFFDMSRYIRDNMNMFIILRYPHIGQVWSSYLKSIIPDKKKFNELYKGATDIGRPLEPEHHNYLTITLDPYIPDAMRIRKNLDGFPEDVVQNA